MHRGILIFCFFVSIYSMEKNKNDEDDYEYIELDTSAALKKDLIEPEEDYCILPNLPFVILSDHCPVCQHHITLQESMILEACTKEKPEVEPHIFHKSCLQFAYAACQECPLCHRAVDETEIFSKNITKKFWDYSKKIICGIPYGFIVETTAYVGYAMGSGTIRISTEFLKTLLLEKKHHPISEALSVFMPIPKSLDMIISAGSTYIMIKGLTKIPAEKRASFLLSLLLGIKKQ